MESVACHYVQRTVLAVPVLVLFAAPIALLSLLFLNSSDWRTDEWVTASLIIIPIQIALVFKSICVARAICNKKRPLVNQVLDAPSAQTLQTDAPSLALVAPHEAQVSIDTCPICMDQGSDTTLENCGHSLCSVCLDKIVMMHMQRLSDAKCPLCNQVFAPIEQLL